MSEITITVNTTTKTGRASEIAVLLDTVTLTLDGIGDNAAASLYAFIMFRGVTYAGCQLAAVDGDLTKAVGTMSLNTATLKAAFSNIHPDGVRCFPLTVVNTSSGNSTVCVCDFNIRNNPATPPTTTDEIDETWLHTHGNLAILNAILSIGSGHIITDEERSNLTALMTHGHTASAISDLGAAVSALEIIQAIYNLAHGHSNFDLLQLLSVGANGIQYGATPLLSRSSHTGTQTASTISDFSTAVKAITEVATAIANSHAHGTNNELVTVLNRFSVDEVSGALLFDGNSVVGQGDVRAPVGAVTGNFSGFADETGQLLEDTGTKPADFQLVSGKGAANGYAELDSSGKVPSAQLPAYVDDVLEYADAAILPATGETGIIYVTLDDNKTYRWSGSAYAEISASLALGETSGTAYRGDRGKTAYDHSQLTSGNPHSVTKSDVGLGNVPNILNKLDATAAPTTGDDSADGYSVGSKWIDTSADKVYECLDATEGAAVWKETTTTPGAGTGDMLAGTYDPANKAADAFDMDNMAEGETNLILNTDERAKLSALIANHAICQGRLTLTTGVPVTTGNVTAASILYFTPYNGNLIGIHDGSAWSVGSFTEKSLSLSGLTASTNYDIFIYDNSGTLTLEALAWTDDTTRATALTTQDGIYVKSGDVTRRYLGTIRITATEGQCENSVTKRFVWNHDNQTIREMITTDSGSHTYTTASWREFNNGVTRVEFVNGIYFTGNVYLTTRIQPSAAGVTGYNAVGIDTVSSPTHTYTYITNANANTIDGSCASTFSAAAGYHYITILELGATTVTFSRARLTATINN